MRISDLERNKQQQEQMQEALLIWKERFAAAREAYSWALDRFDERERLYLGTREIRGAAGGRTKPAGNVRNIVYELVESQIDSSVPQPKVDALREDTARFAPSIEDSLRADMSRLDFARMNDQQERTCPIQGMSFFEVFWDPEAEPESCGGGLQVRLLHPKQVIPQPGVCELQEMEYLFVVSRVSRAFLLRRYGCAPDEAEEDAADEVVCWYRNEQGDVCRFVFVQDMPLELAEDFYARRERRCASCGREADILSARCVCGGTHFVWKAASYETLRTPVKCADGRILAAGERIPYYKPRQFPIIMRENVPSPFTFGGQSDVDVVRDQQEAIKKTVTKMQEKLLKGGSIVTLPKRFRGKLALNDEELKVVFVDSPADIAQIQIFNVQPDISKDLAFLDNQYRAAQSTLGITDSYQGKPDSTALSGVAKQLQISQSSGRLKSKQANKFKAYQDLFALMFAFKLAFADEPQPYISRGARGQRIYGSFCRYDLLEKGPDGCWRYADAVVFSVDASGGFAGDRTYLYEQAIRLYEQGAFGESGGQDAKVRLWQVLETLHYPMAGEIRTQLEEQAGKQAAHAPAGEVRQ